MNESSALRNRNFLIYLVGSTISLHGLWVYRVALAWYTWQLTQSEFWVGFIAFTQFAPAILVGPLFGVIADRFERRKVSMAINAAGSINMLILTGLMVTDHLGLVALTINSLMQGAIDGSHTPVRMSLVPGIVKRAQLSSAIASNSIAFNLSRIIGPAVSGIIIVNFGAATAFAINSLSYIAIVIAVGVISIERRSERGTRSTRVWAEIMEGVHYIRGHFVIRTLLVAITINTVFGRGGLEMMPAVADDMLGRGSAGFATMTSAVGVGAVIIGIFLARGVTWLNLKTIRHSLIASGVLLLVYGFSNVFYVTVAVVCLLGVVLSLCGIGSQILIQTHVDDEVRGRVSSLWGMVAFAGNSLGALAIGLLADLFGLQPTLIGVGVLSLLGVFALRIESKEDPTHERQEDRG